MTMRCGDCPEGQRHSRRSIYCPLYGIIINENHMCELEGGKRHDRTENPIEDGEKAEGGRV